ncbi:tRNA pseudouridine(38-40) synthase TruA [Nocardioides sp. zg-DK7169]|uniref:tRNA pseudouridine(38-40) synthase TruA n=1 Tax=Nocardioides sp. zg-DK7169 TaxID=2736600 RepID=UPI0034646DA2
MRIRIDLAYDGTDFHGWAAQPGLRTVQGELTSALVTTLRLPQVRVVCAGRTDTGVHARGQVAHLDVPADALASSVGRSRDPAPVALVRRLNGILPPDIRVRRVREVSGAFDARFSALWRRYVYRIADRAESLDPLTRHHVVAWPRPLDVELLREASALLVGHHDFAAFCRQREGATTVRVLGGFDWERRDDGVLEATVKADAFCHSQVRAMVGCVIAVGEGRRPVPWAGEVLAARRRDPSVTVAHAHGLTLEEVGYPVDDELAARAEMTRARREAIDA